MRPVRSDYHRRPVTIVSPLRALPGAIAAVAVALALATWTSMAGGAPAPPGCDSFGSQAAAQEYFAALGGGPRSPVGELDDDRDGVACEGLPGPYEGFATIGYSRKKFLYGTASLPPAGGGGEGFPCLYGNRHFVDGPRLLTVFKVQPGPDPAVTRAVGAEAKPASGRLVWKVEKKLLVDGRYYAAFEARQPLSPYGPNECPGFDSGETKLPKPQPAAS
jgi:hypothetical protein